AELREFRLPSQKQERLTAPMRIRIGPGSNWTANDGSRSVMKVDKTVPAPEKNDAAWTLFRSTTSSGHGILSSHSFVERVNADGGAPPATQPERRGENFRVKYQAEHRIYR